MQCAIQVYQIPCFNREVILESEISVKARKTISSTTFCLIESYTFETFKLNKMKIHLKNQELFVISFISDNILFLWNSYI